MPTLSSVVVKSRKTGQPIGGALVVWWDQSGRSDARTTDGSGFCNFGLLISNGITISVQASGYKDSNFYKTSENGTLVVEMEPSVTPFNVKESGYLTVTPIDPKSGDVAYFENDGKRWLFAGYTIHTLITNVAKGDEATVHQQLDYMDEIGANTVISIGCHLSPFKVANGFYYDPRRPDHQQILARLFDICSEHKKRVAHASLADCQYGMNLADQWKVWETDCQIAKDRWNVLPRIGNEGPVNGWRAEDFSRQDVGRCLSSRGSQGMDSPPFYPYWDWAEWEPRRYPIHKSFDDSGAGIRELQHGYEPGYPSGVSVPIVVIEPAYFHETGFDQYGDSRWTSAEHAHKLGVNIACNSAGGGFGASNSLEAKPLGPNADKCAREFFRGLWGAWGS